MTGLKALVLMYHDIDEGFGIQTPVSKNYVISLNAFDEQMRILHGSSKVGVSLAKHGNLPHQVALTFDDGRNNNFRRALNLLMDLDFSATYFVSPALVGSPGYASWASLRRAVDNGMSVQSHGHTHVPLAGLGFEEIEAELRLSKVAIEDELGQEVDAVGLPFGSINADVVAIAHNTGYRRVCSSKPRFWNPDSDEVIPRVPIRNSTSSASFKRWTSGHRDAGLTIEYLRHTLSQALKRARSTTKTNS